MVLFYVFVRSVLFLALKYNYCARREQQQAAKQRDRTADTRITAAVRRGVRVRGGVRGGIFRPAGVQSDVSRLRGGNRRYLVAAFLRVVPAVKGVTRAGGIGKRKPDAEGVSRFIRSIVDTAVEIVRNRVRRNAPTGVQSYVARLRIRNRRHLVAAFFRVIPHV